MKIETIKALKKLSVFDEMTVDGTVWTRFPDGEFKVSPHGLTGDYDTDCRWLDDADLETEQ